MAPLFVNQFVNENDEPNASEDKIVRTNSLSSNWVKPVLKQMGLADSSGTAEDLSRFREAIEEFKIVDGIREIAGQINSEANSHIIEILEFLPPARSIARVRFSRDNASYFFEIVIRPAGPKAVFYTPKKVRTSLQRLLGGDAAPPNFKVELSLPFRPDTITHGDLRFWFVYLISGFKEEFRPINRMAVA
jgi:hypothetical protein